MAVGSHFDFSYLSEDVALGLTPGLICTLLGTYPENIVLLLHFAHFT